MKESVIQYKPHLFFHKPPPSTSTIAGKKSEVADQVAQVKMIVNILYSAPPDGDDASSTFASRASDHCTRDGITIGYVGTAMLDRRSLYL